MVNFQKEHYSYEDMLEIMRLLRAPGGCPWDAEQTHESIRRNFLEETCEAVEAIDNHDMPALREELGDVLMQVIFHAQMEAEVGGFTMQDVIDGLCRKLVYRHPHVFSDVKVANSDEVLTNWEALKRQEKAQRSTADAIETFRQYQDFINLRHQMNAANGQSVEAHEEDCQRMLGILLYGVIERN